MWPLLNYRITTLTEYDHNAVLEYRYASYADGGRAGKLESETKFDPISDELMFYLAEYVGCSGDDKKQYPFLVPYINGGQVNPLFGVMPVTLPRTLLERWFLIRIRYTKDNLSNGHYAEINDSQEVGALMSTIKERYFLYDTDSSRIARWHSIVPFDEEYALFDAEQFLHISNQGNLKAALATWNLHDLTDYKRYILGLPIVQGSVTVTDY